MNLDEINEVWLALEAERARITTIFEELDEIKGELNGKKKENNQTRSTT